MRIVIPLFDRFTALDAVGPYEVLKFLPGAEILFVAAETGAVRDVPRSLALTADATLDDVDSCDVLLVPGGPGARALLEEEHLLGCPAACTGAARGRRPSARGRCCSPPPAC
ncbi:DJ-1/PfpI family protein [Nonomuraea phyllanthi]|uniref:DJ-1/PfpI family protein n=1 Tax=Nonomuraea phyllanthi TaxID=2219224 RepID=UPI00294FF566|nr:DJ-1/PfpI family protein [Nonomuraea phyllanthi]